MIALLMAGSDTYGQSLAQRLFGRKKPATEQAQSLNLTTKSGPWLIMCTSFVGEDGNQQARRLANELRQEHGMNAYVYSHQFNFEQEVAGKGVAGWAVPTAGGQHNLRQAKMTTAKNSNFKETAVLVGDFASVDDSRAQKTLANIKKLLPESIVNFVGKDGEAESPLSGDRLRQSSNAFFQSGGGQSYRNAIMRRKKNGANGSPLGAAFLLTNPLLPDAYFAAQKIDRFVLGMNKKPKYSLLKNKGLYSIKIASFTGKTTFESTEMLPDSNRKSFLNRKSSDRKDLEDAAIKAHVLTGFLRKKGLDAYEFHDRHESYVCVGSFDRVVRADGRYTPEIERMIMKFKGRQSQYAGRPGAVQTYRLSDALAKAGISCDPQPLPVIVPKAPTKMASLLGRNKK